MDSCDILYLIYYRYHALRVNEIQQKEVERMKRILAIVLSLCMLALMMVPAFAAEPDFITYPTIYIKGKVGTLGNNVGTPDQIQIYDGNRVPAPDGYIEEAVKELVPMFVKSMLTDDYTEWAEKMSGVLEPIYRDFVLDKNGKARPGSGQEKLAYDINNVHDVIEGGKYALHGYPFDYDWRLSPIDVAPDLRTYVEKVKEVTGKPKVNLIARCEGACVLIAYLAEYGGADIGDAVFLSPSSNGTALISDVFAGDFHLDGVAVNRYMEDGEYMSELDKIIEDELLRRVILDTLKLMAVTPGVDLTDAALNGLLEKILPMIMPGLLMTSYGTLPSYWAMVDDAHYEQAKTLAGITDDPEYANFVALIDDYHYNIQQKHAEILESCRSQGMGCMILVKYGDEMLPFLGDSVYPNDNTTTVPQASLGATVAEIGDKLDGEGEFISPDGLIDASTAGAPDYTWYAKYLDHDEWDKGINDLVKAHYASGGTMTVNSDPAFPRFLVYRELDKDHGVLEPMTEENAFAQDPTPSEDVAPAVNNFISTMRSVIERIIAFIKGIIEGIIGHAKGTVPPVE